jgi:acyl-CoA thioesterase
MDWPTATAWKRGADGWFDGEVTSDWGQGRTVFGGLAVTAAVRCMRSVVQGDRRLRSVLVQFVGPIRVGSVQAHVQLLRAGSSLTQVEARVLQDGETRTVVLAGFGAARPTRLGVPSDPPPPIPPPEELQAMPYLEGVTPAFTQHFEFRFHGDVVPFSGADEARVQGFIRLREPAAMDEAGVLGLIDAWPPPILSRARGPVPVSSVTWQVHLLGDPCCHEPGAWWRYEASTTHADEGYEDFAASLWDTGGNLVARARQLVVEFSGA